MIDPRLADRARLADFRSMPDEPDADAPLVRPPGFDRTAVRLLAAALAAGALTAAIVMLWRGFSGLMALLSAAGIAALVFFCGRAVRVLNFEWRRPPFEREE